MSSDSDNDQDTAERRTEPRTDVDLPFIAVSQGVPHYCRVVNLSCSGAQIERSNPALPPEVHTVVLQLGDLPPLRLLSRMVWATSERHAVRFLALRDVDRLTIAEYLDDLARRTPGGHT